MKKDIRIVFMGTPDFAVESLRSVHESGYNIVGVITAPDRTSGRGRKLKHSPVKEYALKNGLHLLQPEKLKNESFLAELKSLKADLQLVVAFRMLPVQVWSMPEFGTFNLHASLLPQYRGAAPINHALINGEKTTGLTTFFLDEKIDTGTIIDQIEVKISPDDDFGSLHDKMMKKGAKLVLQTIEKINEGNIEPLAQDRFIEKGIALKTAPKIHKEDCRIDWKKNVVSIANFIRGLSPVPGAYSYLLQGDHDRQLVKIFKSKIEKSAHNKICGHIETDNKTYIKVFAGEGKIDILELQMQGKKRMKTADFLRGYKIEESYAFV